MSLALKSTIPSPRPPAASDFLFTQLVTRWDAVVRAHLHRRFCCFSATDVDDLSQETWFKLWNSPQFSCREMDANVRRFIMRIATNVAIDALRRRASIHRVLDRLVHFSEQQHDCTSKCWGVEGHDVVLTAYVSESTFELHHLMRDVIGGDISTQQQEILSFLIIGYNSTEIGKELGLTAQAVRKALSRLRVLARARSRHRAAGATR